MMAQRDKTILNSLKTVTDAVAQAFGNNCEVVLHDLEDLSRSIVRIVNGHVTGRNVGSPLTDLGIEILEKANSLETDLVGPYFSKLDDGRLLKCVTTLIRNTKGKPIGMLCINIDLSSPFLDFLRGFLPNGGEPSGNSVEHFALSPKDLISRTLEMVRMEVSNQRNTSPSEKNKMLVMELYKRGIFNVKGAVDFVARETGISRYTVYNYIREAKFQYEK